MSGLYHRSGLIKPLVLPTVRVVRLGEVLPAGNTAVRAAPGSSPSAVWTFVRCVSVGADVESKLATKVSRGLCQTVTH